MTDKLVFVSGSGRGIGQAIAIKLTQQGFQVSGCARTSSQLDKTKELCSGKFRGTILDVSDEKAVTEWIKTEEKAVKATPWGLVTAAGVYGPIGPFVDNDWTEWKKALEINLCGTAFMVKTFAKLLLAKKLTGRIALLSGGGATQPQPSFSSYGACKAAVVRFGETMAYELKENKITVNCIAPGAVNTKFTDDLLKAGPDKVGQETYEKVKKQRESGGTSPEKAADLAAYLMSEDAGAITGRLISAVWDPWSTLHTKSGELSKSDIYTLRRIVPEDRGKDWTK